MGLPLLGNMQKPVCCEVLLIIFEMKTLICLFFCISISYSQFYLSAGISQKFINEVSTTSIIQIGVNEHSFITGIENNKESQHHFISHINIGYAYRYKIITGGIYTEIGNAGEKDFTVFTKINYKRHGFLLGYSFNVNKKLQTTNFNIGYMFDIYH